jgi:hypothetical protein
MEETGLEMAGLSVEMQTDCRGIHRRFLENHDLSEWPCKITVKAEPTASLSGSGEAGTTTLRTYTLVIDCGERWEKRTMSPGVDLLQNLNRLLETDYLTSWQQ